MLQKATKDLTRADITIKRRNFEGRRHYQILGDPRYPDGILLPSVTTITNVLDKPGLVYWANAQGMYGVKDTLTPHIGEVLTEEMLEEALKEGKERPNKSRDTAADFGTEAHNLIEGIIKGENPDIPEKHKTVVASFHKWLNESSIELTHVEQYLYSTDELSGGFYGGTVDAIGRNEKGGLVALDWKTSNDLYPNNALQAAAYSVALQEMYQEEVEETWIVRFGKTRSEFEAVKLDDVTTTYRAFQALRLFYLLTGGNPYDLIVTG